MMVSRGTVGHDDVTNAKKVTGILASHPFALILIVSSIRRSGNFCRMLFFQLT